jgi:hypothetical protein
MAYFGNVYSVSSQNLAKLKFYVMSKRIILVIVVANAGLEKLLEVW